MSGSAPRTIVFGDAPISIHDVGSLADGHFRAQLSDSPEYQKRLQQSLSLLRSAAACGRVYGTNTGVGDSCETDIEPRVARDLPLNLLRFHGCGTGDILSETEAAAVVAARLSSLARGYSAVRPEVLQRLCDLLNLRLLPRIPAEGSVGASGDLTPLSYVAALLVGEREATFEGRVQGAASALQRAGLTALQLEPKESLSVMNGTSMMTGLACLAMRRASLVARVACVATGMASDVMMGQLGHFADRIFALKPHRGTREAAACIRASAAVPESGAVGAGAARLQDRYSLRCAPHVIGVLNDALAMSAPIVETELNGVNDNPIVDPETEEIYHGGNFYGGHVCLVMDMLKTAIANVADLLERQLLMLCNPAQNNGLPANLVRAAGDEARALHGFKAMQITASALTAEALKLTMPASAFSRSTENHNQDKVSMGTIASRDCLRILELTETVAVIHLLALVQAVDIRGVSSCGAAARHMHRAVRDVVPEIRTDRRMDNDIAAIAQLLRSQHLPVDVILSDVSDACHDR